MTLINDNRNRFERIYRKKFEEIAAEYGIGIGYEEDRAALDFGLHLTIPGTTFEGVTATRVWFQFKGQSAETLATKKFDKKDYFSQQVEIEHLRQWYPNVSRWCLKKSLSDFKYRTWNLSKLPPVVYDC